MTIFFLSIENKKLRGNHDGVLFRSTCLKYIIFVIIITSMLYLYVKYIIMTYNTLHLFQTLVNTY